MNEALTVTAQVLPAAASYVQVPGWVWPAFVILILLVVGIDLLMVDKKTHKLGFKEALAWTGVWMSLALSFGIALAFWPAAGTAVAAKFAAGYVLELSLSVDNLFVFILIFSHYKVPAAYHHKVLLWGVGGAMVMRALFIGLGSAAVARWHWVLYIFGAFLVYTGIKLFSHKGDESVDPQNSPIIKLAHKVFNVTPKYHGDKFFVRLKGGILHATPLFLVVLMVEITDVIFAVDSIPAVMGITTDPFIVYTSNIFAILGLRSMFFALEGFIDKFRFLKFGLAMILTLIGLKLLFLHWVETRLGFKAGEFLVLGVILAILLGSVLASLWIPVAKPAHSRNVTRASKRK